MTDEGHEDILAMNDLIAERMGNLMDHNYNLVRFNRKMAHDLEKISEVYGTCQDLCHEVAELLAKQAAAAAGITYDLIRSEWQMETPDDEDEKEHDCD